VTATPAPTSSSHRTDPAADTGAFSMDTGGLSVDAQTPTWKLNGVTIAAEDVATTQLVPGSSLSYSQVIDLSVRGSQVAAIAEVTLGGITATNGEGASVPALASAFQGYYSLVSQDDGATVTLTTTDDTYNVSGEGTALLTIYVTWPQNSADSTATMDNTLDFAQTGITLRQVGQPYVSSPCA
jgi:alternate signal-mediated exported protein